MGGKALTDGLTRRQTREEYFQKSFEVTTILNSQVDLYSKLTKTYTQKDSFGDSDIIYFSPEPLSKDDVEYLFQDSKEVKRNNTVISFEYKEMQVDLIWAHSDYFWFCYEYHGNHDLGNFIGKLAHKFGMKFGHDGLWLPIRDDTQHVQDVLVTRDHRKAMEFLGFDYEVYRNGFNTPEEIFQYVTTSPYYNPDFYLLENNNTISKMRDKKRPSYNAFLKFGAEYTGQRWLPDSDKLSYLPQIFDYFPGVQEHYEVALQKLTYQRALKQKFNGNLVGQLTLLWGSELGEFMQVLRNDPYFEGYNILLRDHNEIAGAIRFRYEAFRKNREQK